MQSVQSEKNQIYPVYLLSRTVEEIYRCCSQAVPSEMLGRLLGYRYQWQGQMYTKIVDWVTGKLDNNITYARFTPSGTRECEIFLDERYGPGEDRPREVGLFHSHPFGSEPHFSATDYQTFLMFPYDQPGNVFVLIDPTSGFFKTFIVQQKEQRKYLEQVQWVCYQPQSRVET